ncbi:MAG: hypothetical protein VX223_07315, partial [Myxococcota bacterium]|nr:hypothetical protein [Myxococcota bacterium]
NKALAKDPRQRWHSARDLGDELARYLFANNLKVTSYDIASMIAELFEQPDGADAPTEDRIGMLIDEEVLNLSMLGVIGQGMRADGAKPLNDAEVGIGGAGKSRLEVADIWQTSPLKEIAADTRQSAELNDYIAERSPPERSELTHHSVVSAMMPLPGRAGPSYGGKDTTLQDGQAGTRPGWLIPVIVLVVITGALGGLYAAGLLEGLF